MTLRRTFPVLSLGLSAIFSLLQAGPENPKMKPQSGAVAANLARVQPVPFSHRQHADVAECVFCHEMGESGKRAGLPQAVKCAVCHHLTGANSPSLSKLVQYRREHKPIPWVRVYKLPRYVFFSHKTHVNSGANCTDCHGPVSQRDILLREKEISMAACVDCHLARSVPTDCMQCHTSTPRFTGDKESRKGR